MGLIAAVVFIFGLNFLKGEDFFSGKKTYYVEYPNIGGLMKSNPVLVNGFSVGRVEEISILGIESDYSLRVTIVVDENVMVTDSTTAMLSSSDLLGGKAIVLNLGNGAPLLSGGSLIPKTERSLTDVISDKAIPVIDKVDTIFAKINNTVDDELQSSVKNSILELNKTIKNLKRASYQLNKAFSDITPPLVSTMTNFENLSDSLKGISSDFRTVTNNLNSFTKKLDETSIQETLNKADSVMTNLNDVMQSIKDGDGTLGKLMTDDSVYINLNNALIALDSVATDLRVHPRQYFSPLGKKNNY